MKENKLDKKRKNKNRKKGRTKESHIVARKERETPISEYHLLDVFIGGNDDDYAMAIKP